MWPIFWQKVLFRSEWNNNVFFITIALWKRIPWIKIVILYTRFGSSWSDEINTAYFADIADSHFKNGIHEFSLKQIFFYDQEDDSEVDSEQFCDLYTLMLVFFFLQTTKLIEQFSIIYCFEDFTQIMRNPSYQQRNSTITIFFHFLRINHIDFLFVWRMRTSQISYFI